MAIGDLLVSQGRVSEAVGEYQADLTVRPKAPQVLYRLGRAWLTLGDDQRAEKSLQEALARGANIPEIQRELGKLYVRRQQYAKGIAALEAYLESRPEDAQPHYVLMMAYKSVGDQTAAARQQALFAKYSEDAKRRNQARQAVEFLTQQKESLP
jgi:predicted Zn-dependent protease